ncbi:MAG: hypothetical protein ACFBSC_10665 [Microcoleaceae cyanobacterium]
MKTQQQFCVERQDITQDFSSEPSSGLAKLGRHLPTILVASVIVLIVSLPVQGLEQDEEEPQGLSNWFVTNSCIWFPWIPGCNAGLGW